MNQIFRLSTLPALLLVCLGVPAMAGAGSLRVTSVLGDVVAVAGAQTRSVLMGDVLQAPAVIKSRNGAAVHLLGEDGAQISLGEDGELAVESAAESVTLLSGQLAVWSDTKSWSINAAGSMLRSRGMVRLSVCAAGCRHRPGVYGKSNGGDVVAEYQGGRTVLRDRLFLLPGAGAKPELLAKDVGYLNSPIRFDAAVAAKQVTAQDIQAGLVAYKGGRYDEAKITLQRVRSSAPAEQIVSYYLGLIALEQQQNDVALRELQRYAREDAEGAREREVSKLLTLLTSSELQREVGLAIEQEKAVAALPPEPGSIAVQTFVNRTAAANSALAKGIAAMIISDLGKVPGLKVLERQKMQKLSDEIRLNASGLVDEASAVRAGRLMRAQRVVVGSMGVE